MDLRRPTLEDKSAVLAMMAEFQETGAAHDGGFWPTEHFDYERWLEDNGLMEAGLAIPENWVPAIQLVSFDADGQALGFVNIRLRLNDFLLEEGGHIGYCLRPSERGKGYAKEQLRLALLEAKAKNIKRALLTCSQDNQASRQTILANGGRLEDCRQGKERYWIDLEDSYEQSTAWGMEE